MKNRFFLFSIAIVAFLCSFSRVDAQPQQVSAEKIGNRIDVTVAGSFFTVIVSMKMRNTHSSSL